jgi:hypothetical protein
VPKRSAQRSINQFLVWCRIYSYRISSLKPESITINSTQDLEQLKWIRKIVASLETSTFGAASAVARIPQRAKKVAVNDFILTNDQVYETGCCLKMRKSWNAGGLLRVPS